MKKIITVIMWLFFAAYPCAAQVCDTCAFQNYLLFTQMRAAIFNSLDLSESQSEYHKKLTKQNSDIYKKKFIELDKEVSELLLLEKSGVYRKDIKQKEHSVKNIEKEIYKIWLCENKTFKKSLTHAQKSKLSMIKKLIWLDYKRGWNDIDYYKKNPKMQKFGGRNN